jgi:hypothetical protein
MADGNRVSANPDFFDQQAHDFLLLRDVEGLGTRAQAGPEVGQRFSQAEVESLIDGGRLDRLPFCGDRLVLGPERRHSRARFIERHQLLLVRGDEAVHRRRHAGLLLREVVEALARGIRLPRRVPPPLQFRLD